jgi:nucleoside-diphosphate-sugar epimerase
VSEVGNRPGVLRPGKRRVLVAGVHRIVAVELIQRLLEDPRVELVLAVDRGPCPAALLSHDPLRFKFASADLSRHRQVENLFLLEDFRERPLDSVVHLAFQGSPNGYDSRRHDLNVRATRELLEASLRHRVGKFVFLSSDIVYKLGERGDFKICEDSELDLDPRAHPVLRDTLDAEFLCRVKMDSPDCEVVVLRTSGVFGGGVISSLNLLFESSPPILPIGFDPMMNPTTKERLVCDLMLAIFLRGRGVYNVAGVTIGPLSRFLRERGIEPLRVPGPVVSLANRVQRLLGRTRFHAGFHSKRLHYSLVVEDARFEGAFRQHSHLVFEADGEGAGEE